MPAFVLLPMTLAYLILAHERPEQLRRLLAALRFKGVQFFVHLDAKASRAEFEICAAPDVHWCPDRVSCAWGNISLVDATLALVRFAYQAPLSSDRYILLSGVCYPIQPPRYIESFFRRHSTTEFIDCFEFPNPMYGKPIERVTRFWIKRARPFLGLKWKVQNVLKIFGPRRQYRKVLGEMELAVGSQWWALTHAALTVIVDFIDSHPAFYRFCRYTDCPDEFVFQTVLRNSTFRDRLSHSLTYTRWTQGRSSPDSIDERMMSAFGEALVMASVDDNSPNPKREVLFARKMSGYAVQADELDRLLADKLGRTHNPDDRCPGLDVAECLVGNPAHRTK